LPCGFDTAVRQKRPALNQCTACLFAKALPGPGHAPELAQHAAAGEDRRVLYLIVFVVFFKTDAQILFF
jgi:hypothetical protein